MSVCVGIPRALLYHEFGSLWTNFFQEMKIPFVVSDDTNKQILDRGTLLAIDESCLPLKIYLGHVDSLLSRCSHIFVPRITQYHPQFYLCGKIAGLPDIVRNTFHLVPERLISPGIDHATPFDRLRALYDTCHALGLSSLTAYPAYRKALRIWRSDVPQGTFAPYNIAVIGHNYLLHDGLFCREMMRMISSRGPGVVTPDQVPRRVLYDAAKVFAPDIYWQLSAKIAGAARYFCQRSDVAGVIVVSSFSCGFDALMNEYLEQRIFKKSDKPHLFLTIDEHTGSAGLKTRVEAFLDLTEWRRKR